MVTGFAFLAFAAAGCSSQPRSTYPVLEQTLESDISLDCAGLEDELLKANAIRDAIFEEHGDVIADAYVNSAIAVATDPISGVLISVLRGVSTSDSSKTYMEAAVAAGLRMEHVLSLKTKKRCPSGPTAVAELTDSLVLQQLETLEMQLQQQEITNREYLEARRKLLDDLR